MHPFQVVGMVNLKDFVNGQALADVAAWRVEGVGEGSSLEDLLPGLATERAYSMVKIFFSDTMSSLWRLTGEWKTILLADWKHRERLEGDYSSALLYWLEQVSPTTSEGGQVCVYCGAVCQQETDIEEIKLNNKILIKNIQYDTLRMHMHREHIFDNGIFHNAKNTKYSRCQICDKIIQERRLDVHMKARHKEDYNPKLYPCPYCSKEVKSKRYHWLQEHRNETLNCNMCAQVFRDPNHYEKHQKGDLCPAKGLNSGECEICDNKYFGNLKRHRKELHRVRLTYQCDHCDKIFTQKFTLNRHMQSVEGISKKKQCPECNNFYSFLPQHIKRFHRGIKMYYKYNQIKAKTEDFKCGFCDSIFRRNATEKENDRFHLHLTEMHFPALFRKYGITKNIKTEDGIEKEELANTFTRELSVTISIKPEKMRCNLCSKEFDTKVGQASCKSKMLLHMKHHLGYNHSKKRQMEESSSICPDCGGTGKSHSSQCPQAKRQRPDQDKPKSVPTKTLVRCPDCNMSNILSQKSIHAETCGQPFQGLVGQTQMTACKLCSKVIPAASLASHVCEGTTPELFEDATCPDCFQTMTKQRLKEHILNCAFDTTFTTTEATTGLAVTLFNTPGLKPTVSNTGLQPTETATGFENTESTTRPEVTVSTTGLDAPEPTTGLEAQGSRTKLAGGVSKKIAARVRCPQCGGVILKEEKQRHATQCPGLLQ